MLDISNPIFHNENKARAYLESLRWANGRFCPHCGEAERTSPAKAKGRAGLYVCLSCKKQFTVRVGTVFERSHIPLHKWTAGFYLLASSKKGFSAHQLHRTLGITYKSAWFMAHRIREAMREIRPAPVGGENKDVETDETYIGGKAKKPRIRTPAQERSRVRLGRTRGQGTLVPRSRRQRQDPTPYPCDTCRPRQLPHDR